MYKIPVYLKLYNCTVIPIFDLIKSFFFRHLEYLFLVE